MFRAAPFDRAVAGMPARMVRSDGVVAELDVRRWHGHATGEDRWLVDRCTGPTIDLGCGPGRLVVALLRRRVPALGVDPSAAARRQCRRRGAPILRQDLFGPLPAEGRWDHALLADGNIGIGGDPARLLRRVGRLLRPGGTLLVETDPRPDLLWRGTAAIRTANRVGPVVPWASVGAAALTALAGPAGFVALDTHVGQRCFVAILRKE